ncbi:hypothetical protein ACET3Z_010274 [Daucus carota]
MHRFVDEDTKLAALGVLPSVVALIAYHAGGELIPASGTIIESYHNTIIVLTSTNLLRRHTFGKLGENVLADDLKVYAHSFDGHSYTVGEVCAHDFHYNLVVLKFISKTPSLPHLQPAKFVKLAHEDDDLTARMDDSQRSFLLRPHSGSSEQLLSPGDGVIVLGRYFAKPFQPMVAPGEYWLERTNYDCKEVFMTNCGITRCGDGGPLINYSGKVIGVAFYDPYSTPLTCNRKCCRPVLGLEATNLNAADLGIIARVIPESPADLAGIHVNDVIVKCGGKPTHSFLELFQIIWDKVGLPVELILIRADNIIPIKVNVVFGEARFDQLNML